MGHTEFGLATPVITQSAQADARVNVVGRFQSPWQKGVFFNDYRMNKISSFGYREIHLISFDIADWTDALIFHPPLFFITLKFICQYIISVKYKS